MREFLTADELEGIEKLQSTIERLIVVCDIFIFSCYTGISYSDVQSLTSSNVVVGIDSKLWIMADRVKSVLLLKYQFFLKL